MDSMPYNIKSLSSKIDPFFIFIIKIMEYGIINDIDVIVPGNIFLKNKEFIQCCIALINIEKKTIIVKNLMILLQ